MPIPFKDFDKDVTDFFKPLTGFKYESKSKGLNQLVYINPGYEKGVFSVNFHYDDKQHGLKSKVALADNNVISSKFTFEKQNQKVELGTAVNARRMHEYSGDLTHQVNYKSLCFFLKSTYGGHNPLIADVQLSVDAAKKLQLGAQVVCSAFQRKLDSFKVGARYSCCPTNVLAFTLNEKKCASLTLKSQLTKKNNATLGSFLRVNHAASCGVGVSFGLQAICSNSGVKTSIKSDQKGNYGIQLSRNFGGIVVNVGGNGNICKKECPVAPGQLFLQLVRE